MPPYGALRRNKYICKIRRLKKIILSSYSKTASDNRNKHTGSNKGSMVEDISLWVTDPDTIELCPTYLSLH